MKAGFRPAKGRVRRMHLHGQKIICFNEVGTQDRNLTFSRANRLRQL